MTKRIGEIAAEVIQDAETCAETRHSRALALAQAVQRVERVIIHLAQGDAHDECNADLVRDALNGPSAQTKA